MIFGPDNVQTNVYCDDKIKDNFFLKTNTNCE